MTGVPVLTRNGEKIGRVASFVFETDTGRLASVAVQTAGIVSGLFRDELIISWDAVLEITQARVLVMDTAVKVSTHLARKEEMTPASSSTLMRDAE